MNDTYFEHAFIARWRARAEAAEDTLAAKDAEIARLKDALTWAVSGPMIETGRALGRPQDVLADELAAWINSRPSHYDDTVSLARAMKEDTP